MKSLETIQQTFRVFQILAKVFMILSFVWAGLSALGLLCGIVWYSGGTVVGANQELLHTLTETNGLNQLIADDAAGGYHRGADGRYPAGLRLPLF